MSVTQTVIRWNRNNLTPFQTAERHVRIYRNIDLVTKLETPGSFRQPRVGECEREREREMANTPCDQFAQDALKCAKQYQSIYY